MSALVLGLWLAWAFIVAVDRVLDEVADKAFTGGLVCRVIEHGRCHGRFVGMGPLVSVSHKASFID